MPEAGNKKAACERRRPKGVAERLPFRAETRRFRYEQSDLPYFIRLNAAWSSARPSVVLKLAWTRAMRSASRAFLLG